MSQLVIQDGNPKGRRLCKVNCAPDMSDSDRDVEAARAQEEAAQMTADNDAMMAERFAQAPNYSLISGSGISSITPSQVSLVPGGASVAVACSGFGFSATDVLAFSGASITATTPVIASDATSFTTNFAAGISTPPGDYTFLFNGARYINAVRVRT